MYAKVIFQLDDCLSSLPSSQLSADSLNPEASIPINYFFLTLRPEEEAFCGIDASFR
jgi:hypothetical protein